MSRSQYPVFSETSVLRFLADRGLIPPEVLVSGDTTVAGVHGRNRNFEVVTTGGPSWFLKCPTDDSGKTTLPNEAAAYAYLLKHCKEIAKYLAGVRAFDRRKPVLALELVAGAENLRTYCWRVGGFSSGPGRQLGYALACLHNLPLPRPTRTGWQPALRAPWVLGIHRPGLDLLRHASAANIEIVRAIQRSPRFGELLDELRGHWTCSALVHFDLKGENCLLSGSSSTGRKGVKIIDWELAGIGDSCWDTGSVFAACLDIWLSSTPLVADLPIDQALALAACPLSRMQAGIRSFWSAYVRSVNAGTEGAALLERSIRYAALRLLQTTYEQAQMAPQITASAVALVQLSLNMLLRPREAGAHLLGISLC
jgi:hypothetical protein